MDWGMSNGIARTQSEKRDILDTSAPKIVDDRKFHGPIADDMVAIAEGRKKLFRSQM